MHKYLGTDREQKQKLLRMLAMLLFKGMGDHPDFLKYVDRLDGYYEHPIECENRGRDFVRFRIGKFVFDLNRDETFGKRDIEFKKRGIEKND